MASNSHFSGQLNSNVTNDDSIGDNEIEKSLVSDEKLDRSSPDLWPEKIPGVISFLANSSPHMLDNTQPMEWLKDLDQDDINMLHGFGSLTASALLEKVKELQNLAYQLGLDEAREMTRGKFLNVLERKAKKR